MNKLEKGLGLIKRYGRDAVLVGAGVAAGGVAVTVAEEISSGPQTPPVLDCANGTSGSVFLYMEEGKQYQIEPIIGSKGTMNVDKAGQVSILITGQNKESVIFTPPTKIQRDGISYEFRKVAGLIGNRTGIEISEECSAPSPSSS